MNLTEATPHQTPDPSRTLQEQRNRRDRSDVFEPTAGGRSTLTTAPDTQQLKVGAETHVQTISKEEYEHLKVQLAFPNVIIFI